MPRAIARGRRLVLVIALVALVAPEAAPVGAVTPPPSGIVCTEGPSFDLTAKSGFVGIPDGNTIYMWSFVPGSAPDATTFQLPGPTLCVNKGDVVTVTLHNALSEDVSIVFPGQSGVTVGGVTPVQPQLDGAGHVVSLAQVAAPAGSISYSFTASDAGTYLYQSGTNPDKQVQMGLFGALVVRAPNANATTGTAYGPGTQTNFHLANQYVLLMSEVDPDLHQAVERGLSYDVAAYHPRYWMLNGRSFPDTIAPNGAPWLPHQPYSSFIHMGTATDALVRYLSVGTRSHPFHPHGNHGRIVARDGRLVSPTTGGGTAISEDLTYEKFLVNVGPGQTWDVIYRWDNIENWNPDNPIPVSLPQLQDTTFKDDATWYAGSPYLGYQDELPVGVTSYNECGEYYQMWHSHALNEAANYEAGFGGMMTLQRIDPTSGCPALP